MTERQGGERVGRGANSLPIKLAFVYTTVDKKEPDFGIKRLKQKLRRRRSLIAPTLWLQIICLTTAIAIPHSQERAEELKPGPGVMINN